MSGSGIRHRQLGGSRLKAIVWLGIMAAFVYACVQVVPPCFNNYQFRDTMETTARFASVNRQTLEQIRGTLLKEAEKDDIPIRPEDIKVTNHNGRVEIDASYSITVDLHVYQWTINFHPTAANSALL